MGFGSQMGQDFSLCKDIQTSSGAHSISNPVGTRGLFPTGKTVKA